MLPENACKQNPCQICDIFVKDWLEFLIHIHDKLKNLQQTTLFVDVQRCVVLRRSFVYEGTRCLLYKKELLKVGKDVIIVF